MTCSSSTICNPDPSPPRKGPRRAWRALGLAVLLGLGSSPGWGEGGEGDQLIQAARAALERGDGIDSEVKLRAALAKGMPRGEVSAWMGKAYLAQGDIGKAREWLERGDFSQASAADGWRALGLARRLDGDVPGSGRAYDKALALIPRDASLWVEIGRLRYAGGEHLLAIDAADHALMLDPENVRALEFRGQLVRDRYGLLAALPWFERAIMRNPKDVPVLLEYAATLGEAGRVSEAVTITRRVLELSPKNPRAYYLQAVVAARAGDYELARGLLARTRGKLDGQVGVQMLHGVVELAAGNTGAAQDALEAVLRSRPDYRPAKDLLARAIYLGGQYRYATLRFAEEIGRGDASPYLLTVVARSYEALGDRQRAGGLLDLAAGARSAPLRVVAEQGTVGELLAKGQSASAETAAEAKRRSDPGSYESQALAGDVQLALGRAQAAQERYAAAAQIRMPQSLFERRFQAYIMARDLQGCGDLVEAYLIQHPGSRSALRAATWLALGSGDVERASAILAWLAENGEGSDVRLLSNLAIIQAGTGDPEGAQQYARAAYRLQRASPIATQTLGFTYVMTGTRRQDAVALLDKAQAMVGASPLIAQARARMLAGSTIGLGR